MKHIIVTITGPSSAGKTVLSRSLALSGFSPLISTTTRKPRVGEKDGIDYHFISRDIFLETLRKGGMIENIEYDSNLYGVAAEDAQHAFDQGKPAVLVAEPHGCQQIFDLCSERGWTVIRVFVNNPIPVLVDRMLKRFYDDVKGFDLSEPEQAAVFQDRVDSHGRRIVKILGQEQEEWVKPAYSGEAKYDLIVDHFDGVEDEAHAIAQVKTMVEAVLAEPARKPKP